jgi:hypothetical protein
MRQRMLNVKPSAWKHTVIIYHTNKFLAFALLPYTVPMIGVARVGHISSDTRFFKWQN